MMRIRHFVIAILLIITILPLRDGFAQQEQDSPGPVYIVQEGDTLWTIAIKFNVSEADLQQINNIDDPNQLTIGDRLIIPGLENVEGIIVTVDVPFGETVQSFSRRYHISEETISQLNRLSSPSELFAGSYMIISEPETVQPNSKRFLVPPGQSILELSLLKNINPWNIVLGNSLEGTWSGLNGDILHFNGEESPANEILEPGGLPEEITSIEIRPASPLQGKVMVLAIDAPSGLSFTGSFLGHPLNVFPNRDDTYIALHGVHAMSEPGVYPLLLEGLRENGSPFAFSQNILVSAINYPYDRPLTVDPATLDPAVTTPENAEWSQLASHASAEKMWQGFFQIPSPLSADYCITTGECWSSRFGNRRSYNGSPYNSFHTGLDIVGRNGTEIFAPAPGIVIYAGPLTVRGNATMIDHGWGIYSAYMHQEEILVNVGDVVETGQVIGLVGATGRVEGPHLHWEIWAGGVQVDPLDWLTNEYP